jgi:hypothetical protein
MKLERIIYGAHVYNELSIDYYAFFLQFDQSDIRHKVIMSWECANHLAKANNIRVTNN